MSRAARTPYEEDLSDRSSTCSARWRRISRNGRSVSALRLVQHRQDHVRSIFRKLDVATRPDVVSRARELRLL